MIVTEQELASLLKMSLPSLQRLRRLNPHKLEPLVLGHKRWYFLEDVTDSLKDITPE